MCVVLEMSRPATREFWVNVLDPELPFGGIIEHTNLVPTSWYGGRHLMYLSRYFLADEHIAIVDVDQEAARWIELLEERLPGFTAGQVEAVHAARTSYAAPLVTLDYLRGIPPIESHIRGLYVSTTAQIYPQDRGMSEGVRMARLAASSIMSRAEEVPESA
jgi:protoporphyrinogen oxidase